MLKACVDETPTLEELMVKGEKLGAVNHRDAEGSKFFCIHLLPKTDLKISRPKHIVCQSVSPLVEMVHLIKLKTCDDKSITRQ